MTPSTLLIMAAISFFKPPTCSVERVSSFCTVASVANGLMSLSIMASTWLTVTKSLMARARRCGALRRGHLLPIAGQPTTPTCDVQSRALMATHAETT